MYQSFLRKAGILCLSSLLVFSCFTINEQPEASFTMTPTSAVIGSSISFDASASSDPDGIISSYAWDFDDGSTGTGVSPTHSYQTDGTFTVQLTVTDDAGALNSTTQNITITAVPNTAPTAVITAPVTSGDTATAFSFDASTSSDSDGTVASYSWDFGDSSTAVATAAATHTYTDDGTYTVTLTVTDDDGATDTATETITVTNVLPVAVITAPVTSGDTTTAFSFDASTSSDSDGTVASYSWNFGDSSTAVATAAATHTYTDNGTYTITLTVTDDDGATDTATETITVTNALPQVDAGSDITRDMATDSTTVTFSGTASDVDGTIVSTTWSFFSTPEGSHLTDLFIPDASAESFTLDFGFELSSNTELVPESGGYTYVLSLTAIDNEGGETVDTVSVTFTGNGSTSVGFN